jgi:hypothetical protein
MVNCATSLQERRKAMLSNRSPVLIEDLSTL